jgi:hypothetical protein
MVGWQSRDQRGVDALPVKPVDGATLGKLLDDLGTELNRIKAEEGREEAEDLREVADRSR